MLGIFSSKKKKDSQEHHDDHSTTETPDRGNVTTRPFKQQGRRITTDTAASLSERGDDDLTNQPSITLDDKFDDEEDDEQEQEDNDDDDSTDMDFSKFKYDDSNTHSITTTYPVLYSHALRKTMDHHNRRKLSEDARAGTTRTLKHVSISEILNSTHSDKHSTALQLALNQGMTHREMIAHIYMYGMHRIFMMRPIIEYPDGSYKPDKTRRATVSLLGNAKSINIETVLKTADIIQQCGTKEQKEDLEWAKAHLYASMDNKTKSEVEMRVRDHTQTYANTAIVVYHHMVHIIFNENDKAIRQLVTITNNLRPRDFDGENISRYAHNILAALHYLESHSAVPRDAAVFILEALQTCSVERFAIYLRTLEDIESPIIKDPFLLLKKATTLMDTLKLENKWTATNHKPGATFQAQKLPNSSISQGRPGSTRIFIEADITPPKPGEPNTRTAKDGRTTEHWCTLPKCCIRPDPSNPNAYHRPGRWVKHGQNKEDHDAFWESRSKFKKNRQSANTAPADTDPNDESANAADGANNGVGAMAAIEPIVNWYHFG
jgi:hypothetical protein